MKHSKRRPYNGVVNVWYSTGSTVFYDVHCTLPSNKTLYAQSKRVELVEYTWYMCSLPNISVWRACVMCAHAFATNPTASAHSYSINVAQCYAFRK